MTSELLDRKIALLQNLLDVELSYAAAAVDGEGCIGIRIVKNVRSVRPQYALVLSVSNCDPRLPRKMAKFFGGNVIRRTHDKRRRPLYEWRITSTKAARALEAMRPYLLIKGEQADLFIEFAKTLKRVGPPGHPPEVQSIRADLAKKVADLKVIQFEEAV